MTNDMESAITRRDMLMGMGILGALMVTPKSLLAQTIGEEGRKLITPREFVARLKEASARNDAEAFYEVQRKYEIYKKGPDQLSPIKILDENGKVYRTIQVKLNADNLARVPASPEKGYYMTARPTMAFLTDIHWALYEVNPDDPRVPQKSDRLNFEWRSRAQASADKANIPMTWDEFAEHFVKGHGADPKDIGNAIKHAVMRVRRLSPDGPSTAINTSPTYE